LEETLVIEIFLFLSPLSSLLSTLILFLSLPYRWRVKARQARGPLHFVIQELNCCAGSEFEQQTCAFKSLWLDREWALVGRFYVWVDFFSNDGMSFFWVGHLSLDMENRFFIEAKSFAISVDTGTTELWIQERRKSYVGAVSLGRVV
jgi:hypothetical protein